MLRFATYYHIYNHANGDDNLFREEKDYDFFLKKYHQHIDPIADMVAWCLMKNHFHLLLRIKELEALRLIDRPDFRNLDDLDEKSASNLLSRQFLIFSTVIQKPSTKFISAGVRCLSRILNEKRLRVKTIFGVVFYMSI